MKNLFKPFWIIVLVAIIGFIMVGCATGSTIGGASGSHGFFTGNGNAATLTKGVQEIGSYLVILGLFDSGFDKYATAVKQAEDSGKKVTSVTKWCVFFFKTTAYAQ